MLYYRSNFSYEPPQLPLVLSLWSIKSVTWVVDTPHEPFGFHIYYTSALIKIYWLHFENDLLIFMKHHKVVPSGVKTIDLLSDLTPPANLFAISSGLPSVMYTLLGVITTSLTTPITNAGCGHRWKRFETAGSSLSEALVYIK